MKRNAALLLTGWFLAGLFGAAFLLNLWIGPVDAGKRPTPVCGWDGTVLWAEDLPNEWSLTLTPNPSGVFPGPSSYRQEFGFATTAYFWTRGGGKGLFRPGAQLNDYKPVCMAVP